MEKEGLYAIFDTEKGEITCELFFRQVPRTVVNFVGLAEGKLKNAHKVGEPYYDGLKFHRVIDDFMIQSGCPEGTGVGGPGYNFKDEFDDSLRHDGPGVLSMANAGANTNGSQFFITHGPTAWLDGKHSVFGKVTQGLDVVNAISQNDIIRSIRVERVGSEADGFEVSQERFDALCGG